MDHVIANVEVGANKIDLSSQIIGNEGARVIGIEPHSARAKYG
jgi:hypothetical protein